MALLLVACGQHPEVRVEGDGIAGGEADDGMGGTSPTVDDDGMAIDDGEGGPDPADPDAATGGDGEAAGGGDGRAAGDGDGAGDGQAAQGQLEPQGTDRTGVTDDTIVLGVHAPVTGAAPLPSEVFEQAGDLYWRWITEEQGETVLGRENVEVVFRDDRYDPASARQVCGELANEAFALLGGGGTDGIQACGELAARDQFPYFSPGVTESGLEGNPWYFPASMTYPQQGELLAEMVADRFEGRTAGAVVTQTANFDGAVEGWERGVEQQGIDYATTLRHPRDDQGWHADFAGRLADAGVEVLYINTSPLDYIRFAQVAHDQGHDFQYVGVGVTMGLNDVLANGCDDAGYVDDGIFFSPFPAMETVDDLDPEFREAADTFGVEASDLAMAIWGSAKAQHELLEMYGEAFGSDLTREDFRALVDQAGTVESGIFPPVHYDPDVDFGGQGVHVLEADCAIEEHRDGGTFVTGF